MTPNRFVYLPPWTQPVLSFAGVVTGGVALSIETNNVHDLGIVTTGVGDLSIETNNVHNLTITTANHLAT